MNSLEMQLQDAIGEQQTGTSHVDMLDIGDVIGYLTVPVINVNLPIYKGTSQDVLAKELATFRRLLFRWEERAHTVC